MSIVRRIYICIYIHYTYVLLQSNSEHTTMQVYHAIHIICCTYVHSNTMRYIIPVQLQRHSTTYYIHNSYTYAVTPILYTYIHTYTIPVFV